MHTQLFELLKAHIREPLLLIDVGGHGGAVESWKLFGNKAKVVCFEARADEAEDLIGSNSDRNVEYVSTGLSEDGAGLTINVTAAEGCSSALQPIENLYTRYSGCSGLRPMRQVSCGTTTLDKYLAQAQLQSVHGIKLDTQGFELFILRGGETALSDCQFILIEAEFNPMYVGQPLFGDVDRFLRDRGFVLWRFGNLAHYATEVVHAAPHHMMIGADPGHQHYLPVANGQLFWADAFYVRQEATAVSDSPMDHDAAIAGAALVTQWGFHDLALEMLRKSGNLRLEAEARAVIGQSFVPDAPTYFAADQFLSAHLELEDGRWETDFRSPDGCILYGPYVRLPRGEFEAIFHVEAIGLDGEPLASDLNFDIAAETRSIRGNKIIGAQGSELLASGEVAVLFFNNDPHARYEFRVSKTGIPFAGKLVVNKVLLTRL